MPHYHDSDALQAAFECHAREHRAFEQQYGGNPNQASGRTHPFSFRTNGSASFQSTGGEKCINFLPRVGNQWHWPVVDIKLMTSHENGLMPLTPTGYYHLGRYPRKIRNFRAAESFVKLSLTRRLCVFYSSLFRFFFLAFSAAVARFPTATGNNQQNIPIMRDMTCIGFPSGLYRRGNDCHNRSPYDQDYPYYPDSFHYILVNGDTAYRHPVITLPPVCDSAVLSCRWFLIL